MWFRYVANKLLESGDRDQLMKLVEQVQGLIQLLALCVEFCKSLALRILVDISPSMCAGQS